MTPTPEELLKLVDQLIEELNATEDNYHAIVLAQDIRARLTESAPGVAPHSKSQYKRLVAQGAPGVEGRGKAEMMNQYYGIVDSNGRLFLDAKPCVSDSVDDLANDLASRQYHEPEDGWHVAPVYTATPPTDALVEALKSVKWDCENCDWHCINCGHNQGMTETDLYNAVCRALDGQTPQSGKKEDGWLPIKRHERILPCPSNIVYEQRLDDAQWFQYTLPPLPAPSSPQAEGET